MGEARRTERGRADRVGAAVLKGSVTWRPRKNSISSLSAPARPAACWPTGLTADGKNTVLLLEAGGKDRDPWIHIPAGFYRNIYNPKVAWQFRIRTGARIQQPPHSAAARQGAWRLVIDQRPDLHPRPEAGLRPVASARQHRLVVRRRAALFPQVGGPGARRRTSSTARAARSRCPICAPIIRCTMRSCGREAGGLSVQSRLQRRRTGRRRPAAAYRAQSHGAARPRPAI